MSFSRDKSALMWLNQRIENWCNEREDKQKYLHYSFENIVVLFVLLGRDKLMNERISGELIAGTFRSVDIEINSGSANKTETNNDR